MSYITDTGDNRCLQATQLVRFILETLLAMEPSWHLASGKAATNFRFGYCHIWEWVDSGFRTRSAMLWFTTVRGWLWSQSCSRLAHLREQYDACLNQKPPGTGHKIWESMKIPQGFMLTTWKSSKTTSVSLSSNDKIKKCVNSQLLYMKYYHYNSLKRHQVNKHILCEVRHLVEPKLRKNSNCIKGGKRPPSAVSLFLFCHLCVHSKALAEPPWEFSDMKNTFLPLKKLTTSSKRHNLSNCNKYKKEINAKIEVQVKCFLSTEEKVKRK